MNKLLLTLITLPVTACATTTAADTHTETTTTFTEITVTADPLSVDDTRFDDTHDSEVFFPSTIKLPEGITYEGFTEEQLAEMTEIAETTTTVVTPTFEPLPTLNGTDPETCRIPQAPGSYIGGEGYTGFPVTFDNLRPDQHVRLATIPVDWHDEPGDPEALAEENADVQKFMDYYTTASNGQLTFSATFADKWYRLPELISAYPQEQVSDFNSKLAQAGIDAADPDINFSEVDIVVFIFPHLAHLPAGTPLSEFEFASIQHFNLTGPTDSRWIESDEGWVRNYMGGGLYFDHPRRPVWAYYIHEAAHMFAMPDWYLREGNATLGSTQQVENVGIGPLNVWGVMSTQDGPSRTFVAWTRWLLGWLAEEQVQCYTSSQIAENGTFDVELTALDIYEPGTKTVIIRTGEHSGLLIESRRPVFPDHELELWETVGRDPYGLIVYQIDTTKGGASGTLSLVTADGHDVLYLDTNPRSQQMKVDALFNEGDEATQGQLRIQLVHSGNRDVVRISPV